MAGTALAIASHVVHGYVGNRAMVFPLQYAGWNVDAIHTTNLANHPGYGVFTGEQTDSAAIREVLEGLALIGSTLDTYDVVVTGYAPNAAILAAIKAYILGPTARRPVYVMDPILGDNGRLYVSEEVVPLYRDILASGTVSVVTPNQFEFEVFSGVSISDTASLKRAFEAFNAQYNVANVVLSSVTLGSQMYGVGYTKTDDRIFMVPIAEINCKFFGCGDLFTALVAHNFYSAGKLTPAVLIDSILKLTKILALSVETERKKTGKTDIAVVRDIQVVAARDIYLQDLSHTDVPVTYI